MARRLVAVMDGKFITENVSDDDTAGKVHASKKAFWRVPRVLGLLKSDSRAFLQQNGFQIINGEDDFYYSVIPPDGWTMQTRYGISTVADGCGRESFYFMHWKKMPARGDIITPKIYSPSRKE